MLSQWWLRTLTQGYVQIKNAKKGSFISQKESTRNATTVGRFIAINAYFLNMRARASQTK